MLTLVYIQQCTTYRNENVRRTYRVGLVSNFLLGLLGSFHSHSLTQCTAPEFWCWWCCWCWQIGAWCPVGWCTVHRFGVVQCTSVLTPARHMLHTTSSSGIHSATWLLYTNSTCTHYTRLTNLAGIVGLKLHLLDYYL